MLLVENDECQDVSYDPDDGYQDEAKPAQPDL